MHLVARYLRGTRERIAPVGINRWVNVRSLESECVMMLNQGNYVWLLQEGSFAEVFEVVEIFLSLVHKEAFMRESEIFAEFRRAFELSGSVYCLSKEGAVELRKDEETARHVRDTELKLEGQPTALETFRLAVAGLFGRTIAPKDIVRDIFVAFEDYLKRLTGKSDYSSAIQHLATLGKITKTQKALLEKIYGYRSDSYNVTHAGNSSEPGERDALWFLQTVMAQITYIADRTSAGTP